MLFLWGWQHTRDRQRHAVVSANSTPSALWLLQPVRPLCWALTQRALNTAHCGLCDLEGHSKQSYNVCVEWEGTWENTTVCMCDWGLRPSYSMCSKRPAQLGIRNASVTLGTKKDCEMAVLRSLNLTNPRKTLRFYNDLFLWATAMRSH